MFLQVSAYYFTHRDTIAGVVSLVKKLKIKRIVVGSRLELDILIHNRMLTCTQVKLNKYSYLGIKNVD